MRSRNNRTLYIIIALMVLIGVYFYMRRRNGKKITPIPPPDNNTDDKENGGGSDKELFQDDAFPLKWGDGGENVRTLQKSIIEAGGKLPKYGVDGKFGDETKKALQNLGYSTVVTQEVLDDIMADAQANNNNFWDDLSNLNFLNT